MGRVFEKNGLLVSLVMVISLSLAVGLMLAMINPALFWGVHIGEGAFYKIMPHTVMAGIPLRLQLLLLLVLSSVGASIGGQQGLNLAASTRFLMRFLPAPVYAILAVIMRVAPRAVHPAMTGPAMPENITIT